ncbi:MAG: hypothetical protein J6Y16_02455 [Treponema sp.]|nr:hypothetical protein [Treponema sp.]
MNKILRKAFLIIFAVLILSCNGKQSITENKIEPDIAAKNENQIIEENKEPEQIIKLSEKWRIDLSVYDDVPNDYYISSTSLHLNGDNYSLGYHFGGGPFAYGKYKIEDDKVIISYPEQIVEESEIYTYLLNKIFPTKEDQILTYDSSYKSLSFIGCIRNENCIFADQTNPSPVDEEYDFEGIRVIKLKNYEAYSRETMKLRAKPSTKAEVGSFNYEISEYNWITSEYNVCADKDSSVPYLLAGKIITVTLRTVAEEEIDGIKAPWYRIGIWGGPADVGHYFWIWGGYLEQWPEENRKPVDDLFIQEALKFNVVKKISN